MTWLLTGGAGYIGAHVLRALRASGRDVVVLDDLSTGVADNVPADVPLITASIGDDVAVRKAVREYGINGVVHLAAKKAVPESMARPLHYWQHNVDGMRTLLAAALDEGVDRVVYSSSAAVYGTPPTDLVTEDTPLRPESPYGETKVAGEWMLAALARAGAVSYLSLRYFNVAGTASPELADRSVNNLVPMVLAALAEGRAPQVFGDDYPTRDGSCVRDYIHVVDLADAHVAAAVALEARTPDRAARGERAAGRGGPGPSETSPSETSPIYNVGRGEGVTVKEVMAAMQRAVGRDFAYEVAARRPGDPAAYAADATRIHAELGWQARLDLDDMVRSALGAWQAAPRRA